MNPTYKIFGKKRRELKKELNQLKSHVKNFWYWYDLDDVYGSQTMDKIQANQYLDKIKADITKIEIQLSVKNNREQKIKRILNER